MSENYHPDKIEGITINYIGYSKVASLSDRKFGVYMPLGEDKVEEILNIIHREGDTKHE